MNPNKIDPKYISETCSQRHIQSVIEDLLAVIKKQSILAQEVLNINSDYKANLGGCVVVPISCAKLSQLQEMVKEITWD